MARLDQFEYPLPVVSADVDKIEIETSGNCSGSFSIRNMGGGTLSGQITSNSRCVRFVPEYFNKNREDIKYFINLDVYKKGDVIQTSTLIKSNGGEVIIPITINVTPPEIKLSDGHKIVDINDFYKYYLDLPGMAAALFFKEEFREWLINIGFSQIELYDLFLGDSEKERAVDNFLILAGLKKKAEIIICDKNVDVLIEPGEKSILTGEIQFLRTCPGFIKGSLFVPKGCNFITFSQILISSKDFAALDRISVNYFIDPSKIRDYNTTSKILLKTDTEQYFYINTVFKQLFKVSVSKETFKFEDEGFLVVESHFGRDLLLDVSASEPYVKFEGKKYYVPSVAKIPFHVRVTKFQAASAFYKKQPSVTVFISVKTIVNDRVYEKRIPVSISGLPES